MENEHTPNPSTTPRNALPYRDLKPVGAADFYFAVNATFRFIQDRFGLAGLRQYWTDLGHDYFAPVAAFWKANGLCGVAQYWREYFAAEPGGEVEVIEGADLVVVEVKTCPAIAHLRRHGRPIVPCFCQHCYFVNEAIGAEAGIAVRVQGGGGSCRQEFRRREALESPLDLAAIQKVL